MSSVSYSKPESVNFHYLWPQNTLWGGLKKLYYTISILTFILSSEVEKTQHIVNKKINVLWRMAGGGRDLKQDFESVKHAKTNN